METMDRNIWNDIQSFKSELTSNVESSSTSNCTDPDDLICRFCNFDKLIYKEGNMICLKCGIDNANVIDCDAEWRFYGNDDNKQDPSRVGLPINPLLKTSSLGTCISGRTNNTIKRVHNYTMMTNEERGIWKVTKQIKDYCERGNLTKIIQDSATKFYIDLCHKTKNNEKIITRGVSRESLLAACIFTSCKANGVSRDTSEIAKIIGKTANGTKMSETDVTKGMKKFYEIMRGKQVVFNFQASSPEEYLPRYCNNMRISNDTIKLITLVVRRLINNKITTKKPQSMAAGAIYFVIEKLNIPNITRTEIAKHCETSEVTLNTCYKIFDEKKDILFKNVDLSKINI